MKRKQCTGCGEEKPLSCFRFIYARGAYLSKCEACEKRYRRERYAKLKQSGASESVKYNRRYNYAVKAIMNYIKEYGEGVVNEAVKQLKSGNH